jgi:opacity protein-like surface antigen
MNKLNIATLVLSTTVCANAFAEQSIAANGVYLGAGVASVTGVMDSHASSDPGAALTLGYRINNNFAVEANLTSFVEVFASGQIVDLSLKGLMPVTPNFSLFGKVGAAVFHARNDFDFLGLSDHSSMTRFAPAVGAGLSYNFTPNFSTELGATVIPVSGVTIVPVTLGLRYTFG